MKSPIPLLILLTFVCVPSQAQSQGNRGGGSRASGGVHPSGSVRPAGNVHPSGPGTVRSATAIGVASGRPAVRPIGFTTTLVLGFIPQAGTRPWYDNQYHAGWHQGYWPNYRQANNWLRPGNPFGWLLGAGGTSAYSNPYSIDPSGDAPAGMDYSRPLPTPSTDEPSPAEQEALELFDQAREAFVNNDCRAALRFVERAIALLPTDATLHEFRALTLFALEDYRQASAAVYAVLAAGPGWNWETMCGLYGDVKTYTEQLRSLEAYQRKNPRAAEGHFLLAYHYLTMGHLEYGAKQLEMVVRIRPNDSVAVALLKSLKQIPRSDRPAANP